MERPPQDRIKDFPNLVRKGAFSMDRLLTHIDPGPADESELFVRRIYDQRHLDVSAGDNGKTGR